MKDREHAYQELKKLIKEEAQSKNYSFDTSVNAIENLIFGYDTKSMENVLLQIGIIPEDISHDSSEEKLYSKASDIVLARALREIGLSAVVNRERANCADVVARSLLHQYSLVADAKAFRLSRTAKNQKDFKIRSLDSWRGEHDFAVLVAPYFQYPSSSSQIYGQAIEGNVCLISWEFLAFFIRNSIRETQGINFGEIWNLSEIISEKIIVKEKNKNFFSIQNEIICKKMLANKLQFEKYFDDCKLNIIFRGDEEIIFWEKYKEQIFKLSKEEAVNRLIIALKLDEKISTISSYISKLKGVDDV